MHTPSKLDYQKQLIVASLDDFTPNSTLVNFCGGQYGPESDQWREAVIEFLCKNLRCGLVELTHRPEISAKRDVAALKNLLLVGDVESRLDASTLWDVLYFNGTTKLISIIDSVGLRNWDSANGVESHELSSLLSTIYKES